MMYALHVFWASDIPKKCTQDQHSWVKDGGSGKAMSRHEILMQFLCCIFGRLQNQCVSQNPVAPSKSFKSVFTINLGDISFIEFKVIEDVCMVFSYFSYTWGTYLKPSKKSTLLGKILNHLGVQSDPRFGESQVLGFDAVNAN